MRIDARTLAHDTTLETDLCIVGAGPAGLVLASELGPRVADMVLLESGGAGPGVVRAGEPDAGASLDANALNDGDTIGDPYAGLRVTRHRGMGGTSGLWNTELRGRSAAKYVPLDPADLVAHPTDPLGGWPLAWEDLASGYRRAAQLCGLGPSAFEDAAWWKHGSASSPLEGPDLRLDVYRLASRDALIGSKMAAIEGAGNTRLFLHATLVSLETSGRRVRSALVASPGGIRWRIRARTFVLAGGAVENARILLASGPGLGDESGWVGRGFMEHPRDRSISFVPAAAAFFRDAAFHDVHEGAGGDLLLGRLDLLPTDVDSTASPPSEGSAHASATLFPQPRGTIAGLRRVMGAMAHQGPLSTWLPGGGHGWSGHPSPGLAFDRLAVLLNLEQRPHAENRVVLGTRRDALGVPVPVLHWRWRPEDEARAEGIRRRVVEGLRQAGIDRIRVDRRGGVDPNAHHHAGTTRMHRDPARGVVDATGRVHTADNLFVAGASVFPTAGFANPTLTIVAMAVRLADHLAARG